MKKSIPNYESDSYQIDDIDKAILNMLIKDVFLSMFLGEISISFTK